MTTEKLTITLPEELIYRLKREAREQGRPLSNYVAWLLKDKPATPAKGELK